LHEFHRLSAFEFGTVEEPIPPPRPSRLGLNVFETQALELLKRMVHRGENRPRSPARRNAVTGRNQVRPWFRKLSWAARGCPQTPRVMQRYAHLSPEYMAGALGKLDGIMGGMLAATIN
jgi:hypothetical protein